MLGPPCKLVVFVSELGEWYHSVREIDNEASVEVGEAEEGLDLFHIGHGRPFGDGICLEMSIETPEGDTMNPKNSIEWV